MLRTLATTRRWGIYNKPGGYVFGRLEEYSVSESLSFISMLTVTQSGCVGRCRPGDIEGVVYVMYHCRLLQKHFNGQVAEGTRADAST